jgi:hypothetical protein
MRKLVVAIIGGTVVLLGIGMIVLPGPAVVVIPAGLAILATEFLWARRALQRCKGMANEARGNLRWLRLRRNKCDPAIPPTVPAPRPQHSSLASPSLVDATNPR